MSLSTRLPDQTPVLDRLGKVLLADMFDSFQVCDGPGNYVRFVHGRHGVRVHRIVTPSLRFFAGGPAAPEAVHVAYPLGPVAHGLVGIIPRIHHPRKVLAAHPPVNRGAKEFPRLCISRLDLHADLTDSSGLPGDEVLGDGYYQTVGGMSERTSKSRLESSAEVMAMLYRTVPGPGLFTTE